MAASVSPGTVHLLGLPDPYWSLITTIIVTQSSLGESWLVSRCRLVGTIFGVVLGSVQVLLLPATLLSYGAMIALLGVNCGVARLYQSAYRFRGSSLTKFPVISVN